MKWRAQQKASRAEIRDTTYRNPRKHCLVYNGVKVDSEIPFTSSKTREMIQWHADIFITGDFWSRIDRCFYYICRTWNWTWNFWEDTQGYSIYFLTKYIICFVYNRTRHIYNILRNCSPKENDYWQEVMYNT